MSSSLQTSDWDAIRLVEAALTAEPRDNIGLLLKAVAEMSGALGCVLWRASEEIDGVRDPTKGRMSLLASWFNTTMSSQLLAIHGAAFNPNATTWKAIRTEKPSMSNDVLRDNEPTGQQEFFKHHNITRTLAAPMRYLSGRHGAVSIYRRETASDFHQSDAIPLARVARLLPLLYRAERDRAALALVKEIGEILRDHQHLPERARNPRECQQHTLKQLCTALQKVFHAVEVSVFLEAEGRPKVFACAFTTEGPHATATRETEYSAPFENSFSGLVLREGARIRVYDTQACEHEIKELRAKYPGFTREKRPALAHHVNTWLEVPKGWKPQPHSLMVVPLISANNIHGFLRCWIAQKAAPFFSTDDLELLQLVAEHFTHAVETWREEFGYFASLSKLRNDASTAKEDALRSQREHRITLENTHHQIKGPLAEAKRRVDKMLSGSLRTNESTGLNAIRSLLYRASLMSKTIGYLTKLDKGEQLVGQFASVEPLELVRLVGEICQNSQFRISEKRNIKIEFNADSVYKFAPVDLRGDLDLIAEALNNLVDNALKYSYSNTKIRVFANKGRTGRFYISVTSIGVPIQPQEVGLCKQRLWRGPIAEGFAGEGSGIGLWIVDQVMKALGSELQIIPTRPNDNVTEVSLVFDIT